MRRIVTHRFVKASAILTAATLAVLLGVGARKARAAGQEQKKSPPVVTVTESVPAVPDGAQTGNMRNGGQLYASVGCNGCHGDNAQGMQGTATGGPKIGPPPLTFAAFVMQVREPSGRMLAFGRDVVSDAQLADIYVFLQSLGLPRLGGATGASGAPGTSSTGNADNGKRIYTSYGCYECHGREGQGSTQTGGARIGPPPLSLDAFTQYVRQPANQMPPYTAKAVSDSELADIYAFLLTRPTPPPAKDIPLLNK